MASATSMAERVERMRSLTPHVGASDSLGFGLFGGELVSLAIIGGLAYGSYRLVGGGLAGIAAGLGFPMMVGIGAFAAGWPGIIYVGITGAAGYYLAGGGLIGVAAAYAAPFMLAIPLSGIYLSWREAHPQGKSVT